MVASSFKKADRKKAKLRLALDGPSGSGKTFSGLRFAMALARATGTGRVAVIDTEHGSAAKYVGERPDGVPFDFDHCVLDNFAPTDYTQVIQEAGAGGYDVILIDSLSHAWEGKGGALEQVDTKANKSGNKFTAWADVTPQHQRMIEAILRSPCHVIATMRTKTEYVLEANEKGKMQPRRVGLKAVQRDGMEYEFDVVCDMDTDHLLKVSKTRCPALDGLAVMKPGANFMTPLIDWLENGSTVDPSFYAVSEDDLRTQLESETKTENLSPKEQMKRKLELKRQQEELQQKGQETAQAEPKTGSDSTEGTDTKDAQYVSADQVDRINYLFNRIQTPVEKQIELLKNNGVEPRNGHPHPELLELNRGTQFLKKLETIAANIIGDELGFTPEKIAAIQGSVEPNKSGVAAVPTTAS